MSPSNTKERARFAWAGCGLGTLFMRAAIFDIGLLKTLFCLFLEAVN